jgi:hypothetical protein
MATPAPDSADAPSRLPLLTTWVAGLLPALGEAYFDFAGSLMFLGSVFFRVSVFFSWFFRKSGHFFRISGKSYSFRLFLAPRHFSNILNLFNFILCGLHGSNIAYIYMFVVRGSGLPGREHF